MQKDPLNKDSQQKRETIEMLSVPFYKRGQPDLYSCNTSKSMSEFEADGVKDFPYPKINPANK